MPDDQLASNASRGVAEVRDFRWQITDPSEPWDRLLADARSLLPERLAGMRLRPLSKPSIVPAADGQSLRVRVLATYHPKPQSPGPSRVIPARPATWGGRHWRHMVEANQAAARHLALVDAPTCQEDGCWRVRGRSGVCDEHRKKADAKSAYQKRKAARR